jgi:hypothetical protein
MQCKARPQVGRPNALPYVRKLDAPTQRKACSQVGRPNATQGEFARWSPKRKNHPQRKCPHKGALGKKMSWRMDKSKFWHGGRPFNTASPRLGAKTQRKAPPQDGHPNATQGMSASWAPQHNARHVRKLGTPTQVHNVRKMGAQTKNRYATKTSTQGSTRLKDELEDG